VALYADVLVVVYRFLSPEESVPLIKEWLEPTRSDAVKLCAVRACLTLAQEVHFLSSSYLTIKSMLGLPFPMAAFSHRSLSSNFKTVS